MHIPWSEVELVVAIADNGSLSKAAAALGVTQPTASRRLAALEAALGEPLFGRGVAGTTLTAFGERLLEPARRMAACASEVTRAAAAADARPRGVVRVTAPPGVAAELVAPLAPHLRARLPEVELEVVATIDYLDLTRQDADLALRVQPLSRPDARRALVAVASIEHGVAAFATPAYAHTLPRGYGFADVAWIAWRAATPTGAQPAARGASRLPPRVRVGRLPCAAARGRGRRRRDRPRHAAQPAGAGDRAGAAGARHRRAALDLAPDLDPRRAGDPAGERGGRSAGRRADRGRQGSSATARARRR
jgi:DNA-binding transcriptional LysR family regulator